MRNVRLHVHLLQIQTIITLHTSTLDSQTFFLVVF